jgi:DNA excision repair protein ERCC-2
MRRGSGADFAIITVQTYSLLDSLDPISDITRPGAASAPSTAPDDGAVRVASCPPPTHMSYVIAVRALCEFTARRGDLDLRFTPGPSAQQGMAGHAVVAARRSPLYEAEVTLRGSQDGLQVRGRADGYDPALNRLEEIKTYRGRLETVPENHRALHWAQACVYGCLLCRERGLEGLTVALVYFEIASQRETVLEAFHTAAALDAQFVAQCRLFSDWAARESAHRAARDVALAALAFPYDGLRTGQRELAVAVYRAARAGEALMVEAPTGIGKTLGTLFPMLKACAQERLDKVFFLTAKSSGRALALAALETLRAGAALLPLRVLELVARDKACEHPDKTCHGGSCPLAHGFYDRLPAARAAALDGPRLDRAALRQVALAHQVCPYYLAQELTRWSDVVVGDYNYYFDGSAILHGLAQANQWRVGVLVDEAHNLVARGRAMYSATLERTALQAARRAAPVALQAPLAALDRHLGRMRRALAHTCKPLDAPPPALVAALQSAVGAITEHLADAPLEGNGDDGRGSGGSGGSGGDVLLRFYFAALQFARLAEQFGAHSLFDTAPGAGAAGAASTVSAAGTLAGREQFTLHLRNVVPAPFLAPRFAAAHATVLFSGTLGPGQFYRDTLGLPAATRWLDVRAPFTAEQLTVRIVSHVSTRWRDRERSLQPIVDLMAGQYGAQPGNYLGFLSSFDYLRQVEALLRKCHPGVPLAVQQPGMDEAQRGAFLARFTPESCGIGLAVLGGVFAEGIDLPGTRLIGAFIATLGLPQMNDVNERMRQTMETRFGHGYNYTYLYPGLQKVVQAAGRVIRTEHDRGTVLLIDDRYRRAEVRRLLPEWWHVTEQGITGRPEPRLTNE